VVTGTLISGTISVGDEIEILPGGLRTSVRSLESHKRAEEKAFPGERVAVNLRGLEQDEIQRGDVLTHPGQFKPSYMVDVMLTALGRSPIILNNRRKVRLHHYTSEVEARVILPEMDALEPGKEAPAQLRTAAPIVPATGDRFVLRALSPSITLGGGTVSNPRGAKLKARTAQAFLETDRENDEGIVSALIRSGGPAGVTRSELLGLSGFSGKRLDKVLEALKNSRKVVRLDATENRVVHGDYFEMVRKRILDRLGVFHAENPLKEGMSKQELRSILPGSDKLFKGALDNMTARGEIVVQGDTIRSASHKVKLKDEEKGLKDSLVKLIAGGGNAPPVLKEILAETGADLRQVRSLLNILQKEEKVVRVKDDIYFSAAFVI